MEGLLEKGLEAVKPYAGNMPKVYDITSKEHHMVAIMAADALISAL